MINRDHPIRIAIAGLGFGESVHIPASLSNKNIELVGLWHPRPERLKEACNKHFGEQRPGPMKAFFKDIFNHKKAFFDYLRSGAVGG